MNRPWRGSVGGIVINTHHLSFAEISPSYTPMVEIDRPRRNIPAVCGAETKERRVIVLGQPFNALDNRARIFGAQRERDPLQRTAQADPGNCKTENAQYPSKKLSAVAIGGVA